MRLLQLGLRTTILLVACLPASYSGAADSDRVVPRTEFGAPDLQGSWSIATQTNLERASRFNGQLVISIEDALQIENRVAARATAADRPSDPNRQAPQAGRNVGGYNAFWMDPGDALARIDGEFRSSIIVDPADGKLPYNDNGKANFSAAMRNRPSCDGPEIRPLGQPRRG